MHDFNILGFLLTLIWFVGFPFFTLLIALGLGNLTRRDKGYLIPSMVEEPTSTPQFITTKKEIKEETFSILKQLEAIQDRVNSQIQ